MADATELEQAEARAQQIEGDVLRMQKGRATALKALDAMDEIIEGMWPALDLLDDYWTAKYRSRRWWPRWWRRWWERREYRAITVEQVDTSAAFVNTKLALGALRLQQMVARKALKTQEEKEAARRQCKPVKPTSLP